MTHNRMRADLQYWLSKECKAYVYDNNFASMWKHHRNFYSVFGVIKLIIIDTLRRCFRNQKRAE